jgi:hypothetical protein
LVIAAAICLHHLAAIAHTYTGDAGFESVTSIIVIRFTIDTAADDLFGVFRKIAVRRCLTAKE